LALAFWHLELPWFSGESFDLPDIYRFGLLTAILIGMAFTAGYSWQAALESARMEQALSATQAVLEKEHRLSALGGLAAAAAHELGTPLGTIQVVAKEMLHSLKPDDPLREDAELLVSQSQRCRDILRQLSQKPETRDKVYEQLALSDFLEMIAGPYLSAGKVIHIAVTAQDVSEGSDPGRIIQVRRRPEWLHALSAFVENAVDFAHTSVWIMVDVTRAYVSLSVEDDGPGFSADILSRLGEPYITSREFFDDAPKASGRSYSGMGLGFFIAKTLCEHTGATVTYGNRAEGGAMVKLLWRREEMDISYDD
jgi:two-component system sensor histidine kinase RegB